MCARVVVGALEVRARRRLRPRRLTRTWRRHRQLCCLSGGVARDGNESVIAAAAAGRATAGARPTGAVRELGALWTCAQLVVGALEVRARRRLRLRRLTRAWRRRRRLCCLSGGVARDGDGSVIAAAADAVRRQVRDRPAPHASSKRYGCAHGSWWARLRCALGGGCGRDDSLALGVGTVSSVV